MTKIKLYVKIMNVQSLKMSSTFEFQLTDTSKISNNRISRYYLVRVGNTEYNAMIEIVLT